MRLTTLFRRLLNVTSLVVHGVQWLTEEFLDEDMAIDVKPRWRRPRCGVCGKPRPQHDSGREERRWRHLSLGSTRIWLRYRLRRVSCPSCGVKTEQVPWARHDSRFTRSLEEMAAYLAQITDKTHVSKILGISWRSVESIVERVVEERLDANRFEGLRRIGIDEFSYRRHHRYLTLVVDHERCRIVWASPGRSAETLLGFFEKLGAKTCAQIELATIDMAGGYIKAIKERLPNAEIVFDRFHVQRLASEALDEVRREQLHDLRGTEEGKVIFCSRFSLQKRWNITPQDRQRLSTIQQTNRPLYRAHLLNASLGEVLDYKQPWRVQRGLYCWLGWAMRSRLEPFKKVARTIRKHYEGIMGYVRHRLTNARVEGFNNRLRMIARRAFGFHSSGPLIAMAFLCCGGIQLHPPLPGPT